MLHERADRISFEKKLKHEIKEHKKDPNIELFIQPYGEAYLYGSFENGIG